MKIENYVGFMASHKQHGLNSTLTVEEIQEKLPGVLDRGRSGDGKCTHQWDFLADGRECAIWDYKGARWSGYGPQSVFVALGML